MHTVKQARLAARRLMVWTMVALLVATMALSAALLPRPGLVQAQTQVVSIQRVSNPSTEGGGFSFNPSISADGRYVAFYSYATNLVADDTNGFTDVFVHDRQTGETSRVSVATGGLQGDADSRDPSISADGCYVAFWSEASNLVASDNNSWGDVFVHDRQTGQTTRVSVSTGGIESEYGGQWPSISADGRYVAFESSASNLVASDNNSWGDVFVHDRQTGQTSRTSVASDGTEGNGDSTYASISADGRYVAFDSCATNLVGGDTNDSRDSFVHDRQTGETTRVSVSSNSTQGSDSWHPSISADGRYVAFYSSASNLVAGDTNGVFDIFVRDRQTGETTRVSLSTSGAEGDGDSYYPRISADGRYVAFDSYASNLVSTDTNIDYDVFVHDRQTGETHRVSVASDGTEGSGDSSWSVISADGRYVAFMSSASNLVANDNNSTGDIFVRDRQTDETTRVTLGWDGTEGNDDSWHGIGWPCVSAHGRYVCFASVATNLVAGDTNGCDDVFVRDRETGETTRVSVSSAGSQGDDMSSAFSISADGRYVAFASYATNLVAGDTNGNTDVFVHDRLTGETTRVSIATGGAQANRQSGGPSISGDGRYVAFTSNAALVPDDHNGMPDVYVHDRQTLETARVSVSSGGTEGHNESSYPNISPDGRYVVFQSFSSNLVEDDGNSSWDVFVRDRQTGETTRVSLSSDGSEGYEGAMRPSISADGRYVAFESFSPNLVTGDTNGRSDVFVRDRQTLETARVSVSDAGGQGNHDSYSPSISADGRLVTFESDAANLVTGDTNGRSDVFVGDRQTGETTRVNVSAEGAQGDGDSSVPSISADGRCVVFASDATNLVADDSNSASDVFVVSWENPALAYTPASIDFGARYQNSDASQTLQVQNAGTGTLSYSVTEDSTWCSVGPAAGDSVGETDNVSVAIDTSGLLPGSYSCVILVPSDGGLGIVPAYLLVLPTPVIEVTPASHAFGPVAVGSSSDQTLTVSNNGTADLVIGTVGAADPLAAPFSVVSNTYSGPVVPGDNFTIAVRFSPTADGSFSDSLDIPSNDPNTPSVTVALTGATPNVAPTAPVVDVTPDNPDTAASLVCNITTQSTDANGDTVTYTYQWYKDDVLQSTLTTSTVAAVNTAKGQVWKCVVTPNDGTVDGPASEDQVTIQNSAPSAPVVAVTPDSPDTTADLVCSISTQSTDADGDTVTYTYQWYKDGAVQSALTTNTVPAASTAKGEVWKCVVTPSDGTASGSSAEDQVTIQNTAPTAPVVAITPDSPGSGADLVCGITTESADADGDAITYTYQWYKDGALQSDLTTNTVGAAETAKDQVWKCVVTPSDGTASGPSAEDEVTVTGSAGGFPAGAIAGIVIGVLVLAAAAAFLWFRRSKKAPPVS